MSKSVADFVIERLHEWGIRRIYGYPGDRISGLMGALDRAGPSMEFVQSRHEDLAVTSPEEVVSRWDTAFAADRPCIVDAITDPEVPPLPPHITLEQARDFMVSMAKGDPRRWRAIKQSAKHLARAVVPDAKPSRR